MRRWMGVGGVALLLWLAAGWGGARMEGAESLLRIASAGEVAPARGPAWLGLFTSDLLFDRPESVDLSLRQAPLADAPSAGVLRVSFHPESGLRTDWLPPHRAGGAVRLWLDASALGREPAILRVEPGMILVSPRGDVVVLEVRSSALRVRLEQPADMWCDLPPRPPLDSWESFLLQGRSLQDANGHLRVRIKYTRGC
jgi:hypothetical protein